MSKTLTTKEALQALLDGKKIRNIHGGTKCFLFINSDGELVDQNNEVEDSLYFTGFEIYEEPKPKKQVWQWRFRDGVRQNWCVDHELKTEQEALDTYRVDAQKHAGPFEVEE